MIDYLKDEIIPVINKLEFNPAKIINDVFNFKEVNVMYTIKPYGLGVYADFDVENYHIAGKSDDESFWDRIKIRNNDIEDFIQRAENHDLFVYQTNEASNYNVRLIVMPKQHKEIFLILKSRSE
jgi:hypothetical protein